jgi:hypothetical protein
MITHSGRPRDSGFKIEPGLNDRSVETDDEGFVDGRVPLLDLAQEESNRLYVRARFLIENLLNEKTFKPGNLAIELIPYQPGYALIVFLEAQAPVSFGPKTEIAEDSVRQDDEKKRK